MLIKETLEGSETRVRLFVSWIPGAAEFQLVFIPFANSLSIYAQP
jgi:hypothetical protein